MSTQARVCFSLASCQYPADFFDHMSGNSTVPGPADASAQALLKSIEDVGTGPSMLLFLGDQVYVDATAGLFDPTVLDDRYSLAYVRQSPNLAALSSTSSRRVYVMPDDHEISDNWEPGDPALDGKPADPARGLAGEPSVKELGLSAYRNRYRPYDKRGETIWRDDIVHRGLSFFLGDARTEREGRTAMNWRKMKIMNDAQFSALCHWLAIPANANLPKFVSTASALLPRRLAVARDPACALHSDAWDGYPMSMHALLAYVCEKEVKGLVFLSGDEHISNCVWARVTNLHTGRQCIFHSVHSSALYAPYPFANAVKEDFARSETFDFPDPLDPAAGRYRCEVRIVFAPEGDGFALLTALGPTTANGTDWQLNVAFHDANGPKEGGTHMLDLFPPAP